MPVFVEVVLGVALVAVAVAALFLARARLEEAAERERQARARLEEATADVRRLPVVAELPIPAPSSEPLCKFCVHFDLEEGQAIAQSFPVFVAAAVHIPPAEYGRGRAEDGTKLDRTVPARTKWEQFGACTKHKEGVWGESGLPERGAMYPGAPDCFEGRS